MERVFIHISWNIWINIHSVFWWWLLLLYSAAYLWNRFETNLNMIHRRGKMMTFHLMEQSAVYYFFWIVAFHSFHLFLPGLAVAVQNIFLIHSHTQPCPFANRMIWSISHSTFSLFGVSGIHSHCSLKSFCKKPTLPRTISTFRS